MTRVARIVEELTSAGLIVRQGASLPSEIAGLTDDSRHVEPGFLFCAVVGEAVDGHAFLAEARAKGATLALVADERPGEGLQTIVVSDGRRAAAVAAAVVHEHPERDLDMIGVTGTNGKTTTVALVGHLLNEHHDTAVIGTLGAFDGKGMALYREGLTTPGVVSLYSTLSRIRGQGGRRVVMEVSSHALEQQRVAGLSFAAAVFTNLSHDHLDYHLTFERYFRAKARLNDYLPAGAVQVVNLDDDVWGRLPCPSQVRRVTYGARGGADVRIVSAEPGPAGTRTRMEVGPRAIDVVLPLVGTFNVSNAAAAAATAWSLGMDPLAIEGRLATCPQVPGRMERLTGPHQDVLVLRDYAHTPDALERAIGACRPLARGRVIVVIGCGGDRDRRKRPAMGRIAAGMADLAVLTSDNPRTEAPERIIADMEEGVEGRTYMRVIDRRQAIARAVGMMQAGDVLLLAGKGHETYQVVGHERRPFDEPAIVRAALMDQGDDALED